MARSKDKLILYLFKLNLLSCTLGLNNSVCAMTKSTVHGCSILDRFPVSVIQLLAVESQSYDDTFRIVYNYHRFIELV